MFQVRRAALRLLSSPSPSFVIKSRALSSFSQSPLRVLKQSTAIQFQQRWATTGAEAQKEDAPISKLQPTAAEEVENTINQDNAAVPTDSAANESTANTTEAEEPGTLDRVRDALGLRGEDARSRPSNPSENTPKPTVFVGNLFFDVTEDDLTKELARFGSIQRVKLVRDARGLSKGFGYVTFRDTEEATSAIAGMNQQLFEGRRLNVQYATVDSPVYRQRRFEVTRPSNPPSKTLFIGNMSWNMTDKDLNEMFRPIKNVIDVRVAIDRRTGQPRGFAHADFIDVKSAMDAMKILQGKESYGRTLRLDYSYGSSSAPRNQARDDGTDSPSDRS